MCYRRRFRAAESAPSFRGRAAEPGTSPHHPRRETLALAPRFRLSAALRPERREWDRSFDLLGVFLRGPAEWDFSNFLEFAPTALTALTPARRSGAAQRNPEPRRITPPRDFGPRAEVPALRCAAAGTTEWISFELLGVRAPRAGGVGFFELFGVRADGPCCPHPGPSFRGRAAEPGTSPHHPRRETLALTEVPALRFAAAGTRALWRANR